MAYCSSCGKVLEGAGRFCSSCGSPVPELTNGAAVAAPPPPPAPVYPQDDAYSPTGAYPPVGAYPPGGSMPPKRGHGLVWLLSGVGALVVIVAVVCVLVFVVFAGGDDQEAMNGETIVPVATTLTTDSEVSTTQQTTSSTEAASQETSDPEQVVQQIFVAMENQDVDTLVALMDPSVLSALPEGETLDMVKTAMAAELKSMGSMEFSGIEMSIEMTSETSATATLTAGTVTVTDTDGLTTSEDVQEADSPVTIELVKVDGKWYMESSPFL